MPRLRPWWLWFVLFAISALMWWALIALAKAPFS